MTISNNQTSKSQESNMTTSNNRPVKSNNNNSGASMNLNLATMAELADLIASMNTKGLTGGVGNYVSTRFDGRAFNSAQAFQGTGLEQQGFTLIAHRGVNRSINLRGVALVNSSARVTRIDTNNGAEYAWDDVFSSYFSMKFGSKFAAKPSFGAGDSPSVSTDGYVVSMCTKDGLQPKFAEDCYRGGSSEGRVPLSIMLQSSVANLDPQGDAVREFLLKSLLANGQALVACNHGIELRVMVFFEHIHFPVNKFENEGQCPYYVSLKGDCFGVWARPFNPDAFKTGESQKLGEQLADFEKRAGIGRLVTSANEAERRAFNRLMGIKDEPVIAVADTTPVTENVTLQGLSNVVAKAPQVEATVADFTSAADAESFFGGFADLDAVPTAPKYKPEVSPEEEEVPAAPKYKAAPAAPAAAPAAPAAPVTLADTLAALEPFLHLLPQADKRTHSRLSRNPGGALTQRDEEGLRGLIAAARGKGFQGGAAPAPVVTEDDNYEPSEEVAIAPRYKA